MGKYLYLLKYELKTIVRDPLSLYMCSFPVILLILATAVFPLIFRSMDVANDAALRVTMLIVLLVVLTLGSFFLSFLTALLLVENKDEHTLATIAVTPVGTSGYVRYFRTHIGLPNRVDRVVATSRMPGHDLLDRVKGGVICHGRAQRTCWLGAPGSG